MVMAWGWTIGAILLMGLVIGLFLQFNRHSPNGIMRSAMHSWQTMMAFALFYVDWPKSLNSLFNVLAGLNLDFVAFASPNCIGIDLNFYQKLAVFAVSGLDEWLHPVRRAAMFPSCNSSPPSFLSHIFDLLPSPRPPCVLLPFSPSSLFNRRTT